MHLITAISGNTITVDLPVTISYRVSNQAQLYNYAINSMVWKAGIESLTVEYGDSDNIQFYACVYCWGQNVESRLSLGSIDLTASFRTQLEGMYIHNLAWPVPGGAGYAISVGWYSSEFLVENSISMLANKVIAVRSGRRRFGRRLQLHGRRLYW